MPPHRRVPRQLPRTLERSWLTSIFHDGRAGRPRSARTRQLSAPPRPRDRRRGREAAIELETLTDGGQRPADVARGIAGFLSQARARRSTSRSTTCASRPTPARSSSPRCSRPCSAASRCASSTTSPTPARSRCRRRPRRRPRRSRRSRSRRAGSPASRTSCTTSSSSATAKPSGRARRTGRTTRGRDRRTSS